MHFIKYKILSIDVLYIKLLVFCNILWLFVSLWYPSKFKIRKNSRNVIYSRIGYSALYMLFLNVLFVVLRGYTEYSRLHVIGTFLLLFLFEIVFVELLALFNKDIFVQKENKVVHHDKDFSFWLSFVDSILLIVSFFLALYIKRGSLSCNNYTCLILLLLIGIWFIAARWTQKFHTHHHINIYYAYSPFIKAAAIMAASFAVLIFAFKLFNYSRFLVFAPIVLLLVLEAPLSFFYFLKRLKLRQDMDIESIDDVKKLLAQEALDIPKNGNSVAKNPAIDNLKRKYLKDYPGLVDFIASNIDLLKIEQKDCTIFNTHTVYNIEYIENSSLSLFGNLHVVNDFKRINKYFLQVHKALQNGGYFVGCKNRFECISDDIYKKYPKFMAKIIYVICFIVKRIFPKTPVLKQIYFLFSNGKNRVLSKAELLGRLFFCGFKVVAVKNIDKKLYYIAQKVKTPSLDQNPSYGPIIDLQRIGFQGKIINIKKMRTMHPYSEYIQDYIYEQNNLAENGKFKDDFRVTSWGKVLRKTWLDELPQLVNFVRGDVNLIGVRAISQHYFQLYPKELQQLRIQFKPGLVPPYYADMPKTFDEIVDSEWQYLQKKMKNPLWTDVVYFFKAFNNIIFKHARSQ